jgi:hypothetical protein
MKQLSKTQNVIFLLGGLLMVIGAGASLFLWAWASYVYALGAVCFTSMQMLQQYEGTNFTIRRLRRMILISDVLFLLAALLMFANLGNFLHLSQVDYIQYVYNKWVIVLLIAAILLLYSSHRIGNELEKEGTVS